MARVHRRACKRALGFVKAVARECAQHVARGHVHGKEEGVSIGQCRCGRVREEGAHNVE